MQISREWMQMLPQIKNSKDKQNKVVVECLLHFNGMDKKWAAKKGSCFVWHSRPMTNKEDKVDEGKSNSNFIPKTGVVFSNGNFYLINWKDVWGQISESRKGIPEGERGSLDCGVSFSMSKDFYRGAFKTKKIR